VAIAAATRMGPVELSVSDLGRSLEYWQRAIGLRVLEQEGGNATLGADAPLVRFVEEPGATPAEGYTGLFHVALLVPDRPSLARFLAHAGRERVGLTGLSDHAVSEAIYLRDPDRHGIEVYADRPRELWEGQVDRRMTTAPLDVDDLLGELGDPSTEPFEGLPDGTTVGHVHFRVADVDDTIRFYRDVLGLDLVVRHGEAAFLSAGGYHHHVAGNTWESRAAPPAPPGVATLRHATIVLPDTDERGRVAARVADGGQEPEPLDGGVLVRDPSQNALLLVAE
jgi:catechol 2,3-dioxygenase